MKRAESDRAKAIETMLWDLVQDKVGRFFLFALEILETEEIEMFVDRFPSLNFEIQEGNIMKVSRKGED